VSFIVLLVVVYIIRRDQLKKKNTISPDQHLVQLTQQQQGTETKFALVIGEGPQQFQIQLDERIPTAASQEPQDD
jgi:hypothetical protein